MQEEELLDYQKAINKPRLIPSLLLRIKSSFLDTLVIIFLMFLAFKTLDAFQIQSGAIRGLTLLIILMYEPIMVSVDRTLGQRMTGLWVRDFSVLEKENLSTNINIFHSIFRYLIKLFLGWISLLTIQSDKYGRAIHDKVGNSVMTRY